MIIKTCGVENVLDVSTIHLPSSSPSFGDLSSATTEQGFVVFVQPGCQNIPDWISTIHSKAISEECLLVLFDADGLVWNEFQTYDW